jgi:hypothetical protein
MRIGSTIFFAVAAVSISATINNATQAIGGDRVWLTSLWAVGALVTTVVCLYVGFRLFRNGM